MDHMTPERWSRVKAVAQGALAQEGSARQVWIAQACGEDADLGREVASIVAAADQAGTFIESPALAQHGMAGAVEDWQATSIWVGQRIGPYEVEREIGHGGMGAVYLAVRSDDEYRKKVAIKVIRSAFAPESVHRRFRQERQILADLDHPNIARLLDGGSLEDGTPYIVMEHVTGLPIDRYCAENGLTVDQRLSLFLAVCEPVRYAHQHLVVHRDLKSSNIFVTADGTPKLLDFGIAKLLDADAGAPDDRTLTTHRVMSLESASPEQVRGETVTTSTDVFALGVLLHRLLTSRSPWDGAATTSHDLARAICDSAAPRPSEVAEDPQIARRLRGDLDTIVLKALQKSAERRYGTVEQLASDVSSHLRGLPVLARPDTVWYRATTFVRRHRIGVAATVLVIMSLIGGIAATAREAHVARLERARAERRFNDVRRLANSFLFEFHDAIEDLPGSTKARELVVRRALEYLDSLSKESANDPSLERDLAASYEKVGDVQGLPNFPNLGNTAGALSSHRAALALRQGLVSRSPSDLSLQRELAVTYTHLTALVETTRDFPAALEYARKGLAIREMLQARNPGGGEERQALAVSYHSLSTLMSGLGDRKGALDYVRRETAVFESSLASDPANSRAQRNAAIAYRRLGAELEVSGDSAAALTNYRRALALDAVRAPANAPVSQAHLDLSYDYASIGYTLSTMADTAGALENYRQALLWRERVAAADPHDVNAKEALARAHLSIGNVLVKAARFGEGIESFQKALAIATSLRAADPGNRVLAERMAYVYGGLAHADAGLAAAARDPAQALRSWRAARGWAKKNFDIWSEESAAGTLAPAGRSELDAVNVLLARCEHEMARLSSNGAR
jgi:eukaryotic-like serine/threonine-protein kinase